MDKSGAALDHAHEVIDSGTTGKGRDARWCLLCRCGHKSLGLTLDSAARAHRGHAGYAHLLGDTGASDVGEVFAGLLVVMAVAEWVLVFVKLGEILK